MKPSAHYYVLFLSERISTLFEAFRDMLIDIQNKSFPLESSSEIRNTTEPNLRNSQLREFIRTADRHFDHYFRQDPLPLVVVGERKYLSIFESVTSHQGALMGRVEDDYTATSPHDLGKIVWPVVKEVLAGTSEKAMHDLEAATNSRSVVSGIEAVAHIAGTEMGGTLFVEEDYRMKGGIRKTDDSLFLSEDLDLQEVIDDVVDAIIDMVLKKDGNVVFMDSGSLITLQRIAFIKGD
jgi:hypothetical protein